MFSRHTYLVVGLMVAGGAPYLSSKPGLNGNAAPGTEPIASADGGSIYRFASADGKSIASGPSTNPFGGATAAGSGSPPGGATNARGSYAGAPSGGPAGAEGHSMGGGPPPGHSMHTVSTQSGSEKPTSTTAHSSHKLPPVDGSQPIRFEEVFRLDVNSAWLMARWPRVTTGLAELDLHGYRVALLTGTREDDLAGALTYYYDKEQVIQKMTFRGFTGDPRRLVHYCTTQYEMQREIVNDPALQVYRSCGGRRPSQLAIRPASVIRADAPRERFEVDLVLHR